MFLPLLAVTVFLAASQCIADDNYIVVRGDLSNSRLRFERDKRGRVAFLGGSITHMANGWREITCKNLQKRFPHTQFDFLDAGIPSTDSTLGAFRLGADVFQRGPVDLLFVEFAVNDYNNGRTAVNRVRGMEGVVRQARRRNPNIDIVMLYFVEPDKMERIRRGERPAEIVDHEKVATHYAVSSIDLAAEVTAGIDAGRFTWEQFGGLHPGRFGHELYAASIERLFDAALGATGCLSASVPRDTLADKQPVPPNGHPMPRRPLDEANYERGRYVDLNHAIVVTGWRFVESWKAADGAGTRAGFRDVPMLEAVEPGSLVKVHFKGTAIGLLIVAGPDVGVLEFRVDGGPYRAIDQYTRWSGGLHIPWALMLDDDLEPGEHELALRTTARKNPASRGHAARIVKFLAN